jgi:ferric-dicitrate binding protein FerR (iron transport regulator)
MSPVSPNDPPDPEILGRYLAGEATESEAALVRRWFMARPAASRALDVFLARLDDADAQPEPPDHAQSWNALAARIRAESPRAPGVADTSAARPIPVRSIRHDARFARLASVENRPWWRSAGAATAAVALIAAGAFQMAVRAHPPAPAAPRVYETTAAQRADLGLTDGTHVVLAPASRLRVATDFGNERRDLYLDGEAFFDVAHDSHRPFTVYAGNASAHDIGTAFSVRSYAEDGAVQIVVREGVVAMSGVGPLAAGDVGRLTKDGKTSVRHGADVSSMLGWLDGRLDFEDAPLARVLDDVRRWHHVDVELRDSTLGSLPFTGSIGGLPTSQALELVSRTLGLRLTRENDRYTLDATAGRTPRRHDDARR